MTTKAESPTIRLAVGALGGLALTAVFGIIGLSATDRLADAALAALAGTAGGAVGALSTLLTTFTPAPLPGGRRVSDQQTMPDLVTTTDPPAEQTGTATISWGDPRS